MSRRWTYRVVEVKAPFLTLKTDLVQDTCNQLGQQGWELVSTMPYGTSVRLFFKKEM